MILNSKPGHVYRKHGQTKFHLRKPSFMTRLLVTELALLLSEEIKTEPLSDRELDVRVIQTISSDDRFLRLIDPRDGQIIGMTTSLTYIDFIESVPTQSWRESVHKLSFAKKRRRGELLFTI